MAFPMTLQAFYETLPDEASCWWWLRWMPWWRGFRCPRCGGRERPWLAARTLEQRKRCRYRASLTAGTVLHKTRVPLRLCLLAVFFVARRNQSISALQLQRGVGLDAQACRFRTPCSCPAACSQSLSSASEYAVSVEGRTE